MPFTGAPKLEAMTKQLRKKCPKGEIVRRAFFAQKSGRARSPVQSARLGKQAKQQKAVPAPIKPQGKTTMRTPTGAFDGAAGKDEYPPERVIAQRLSKGVTQYLVKWLGYESKGNTWEPIEHLAGCEDMIADFKEREKTRTAQLEVAAEEKRKEKEAAAAAAAAAAAEAAAAARVAARATAEATGGDAPTAVKAADASTANALEIKDKSACGGKRSCWAWAAFSDVGCEAGKACCKLMKTDGTICGKAIRRHHLRQGHLVTWSLGPARRVGRGMRRGGKTPLTGCVSHRLLASPYAVF